MGMFRDLELRVEALQLKESLQKGTTWGVGAGSKGGSERNAGFLLN